MIMKHNDFQENLRFGANWQKGSSLQKKGKKKEETQCDLNPRPFH